MLCIGIDVAKFKHSAAVIGEGGERLLSGFEFANSIDGFQQLLARLSSVGASCDRSTACLEATGHYGRNLVRFLESHGYRVAEVNPLLTSNWRKAMSMRSVKNDAVDAEALALWLFAGNPAQRRQSAEGSDGLRSLTRFRSSSSHIMGDCKRRAVALLDVLFPELQGFFSDAFCKTSVAVLQAWPGSQPLARAHVDSIEEVMRAASGGRCARAHAVRLKALAESSIGQDSAPLGFQLRQLLSRIAFLQSQLAELDKELTRLVGASPIMTIPGIGVVCAAGILGELGDVSRFGNASRIVAFAGCDPTVFASGEFEGTRARLSKRGSPYLRWYLWVAADRARRYDPALKAYYLKKRSEGKCYKVAISAVVRKLCAIIYAVLRDEKPYVCPNQLPAGL